MTDKPKKPRKVAVNSPDGVAAAIVAGGKKIVVPVNIRFTPKERLIFTELCAEFSKTELTAHKIRLVAALAKEMAMLDEEQVRLRAEGTVLTNSHGNAVTNPRAKAVQNGTSTVLSLRRSLGIHARELSGGDNRRTGVMRGHNMANETMLDDIDREGLLNRPNVFPFKPVEDDDDE